MPGHFEDNGEAHVPLYSGADFLQTVQELFVTPRNLIIVAMAWSLAVLVGKILPDHWVKGYKAHVTPALLLMVCCSAVWISGLRPEIESPGWRIALGIILALCAYIVPVVLGWMAEKYLPEKVVKHLRRVLL